MIHLPEGVRERYLFMKSLPSMSEVNDTILFSLAERAEPRSYQAGEILFDPQTSQGQVFVVHDRVQTIQPLAAKIEALVPEATVGVGHGQMEAGALEKVLVRFVQGELRVLVCTTIIESGIDMPGVNTILVNRAHMMGLAQLYQLRGRVGRGHLRGY